MFAAPSPPCCLLSGLYADAQPYTIDMQADGRSIGSYLHDGWSIKAALDGPPRSIVLQKGDLAVWCNLRTRAEPVTLKGIPQALTASCAEVR